MFSRFFIDRPIFAAVLSIFLVLAGLAAMRSLPIAQYPEIAPPVVTVQAIYPGASAEVLEQTVAAPLENAINGVPGMIYMGSNSASNGLVQIQVTFEIGTNIDDATVNVSNRVKQVEARLPLEVRRQGVNVERGSSAFLQVLAFYSPDGRHDDLFISNYVTLNILDELKRLPGSRTSSIRSRPRGGSPIRRSSATSSCAPTRTARRCGSPTSRASSSAPRTTSSSAATTAGRRRWSASSSRRAPMRSTSPRR
jgi:multidrug efflux pump subunit AcrB